MAYLEREYPSADRRNEDLFTLYVTNLPEELNKDGIAQIFQAFGEIQLLSPPNARWAYVSYNTYKEAEHAIRALNDRSPLFLKVGFQKKKPQQKLQYYNSGIAGPLQENLVKDFRYSETGVAPIGSYRSFIPGMVGAHFARCPSYNQESDGNSVYPSDLDHNMYNPYESVGRYAETNAMWSRGCVNVDNYGKRYVSMGRGFTRYHIPEPHPNRESQIGRIYEKRRSGLYEYGEDRLQSRVGKCQLCTRVTTLQCERCAGFYCSRECQLADFARHKMECKTIPGLVGGLEVASISRSSSDEQLLVPRKPGGMDLRGLGTLRRPKGVTQQMIETKVADRETLEQTVAAAVAEDLNCVPLVEGIRREKAIKEKPAPPVMDRSQPGANENSPLNFEYNEEMMMKASNGYNNRSDAHRQNKNRRYDENSNERYRSNPRQQEGGFRHEQNGYRNDERSHASNNKENNRPFDKSESFQSGRGYSANAVPKQAPSEIISEKAKTNFMKMEEELSFQRDPRALTNIENQTPLVTPSQKSITRTEPIESLFSKTAFTDVVVVYPMPDGTFWIHRQKDVRSVDEMMRELQTKAQCYPVASELAIGEMYAVKYNDIWHRATLVSRKPLSIFYVDFGNEESPQSEEFRLLMDFPKHPPYAIRMRLSASAKVRSLAENSTFSVRMVSVDGEGVMEVAVDAKAEEVATALSETSKVAAALSETSKVAAALSETSKMAPASSETSKIAPALPKMMKVAVASLETPKIAPVVVQAPVKQAEAPKAESPIPSTSKVTEIVTAAPKVEEKKLPIKLSSTLDSIEVNATGYLQVYMALNNNSYAVCALNLAFSEDYQMVYEKLTETCNATDTPMNFTPRVDDFVCGKREEVWLRGYVSSLGPPVRLALVDEARIWPVEQVLPMPADFEKICSFGCICTFQSPGSAFGGEETGQFTVTGVETVAGERVVNALLNAPECLKGVAVTLKNWSPTPEQKGIAFAELKSKSEVCITAYSSERIMFVHSIDAASLERTQRITQDVAKWAQKAPKLDGPPAIGQLVIAKFTDGNFYRAIVTKLQDEKIGVSYVDYGNHDFTTIDQLRLLSDELKQERSCAAKIVLKDIKTDVPPTQEVHKYLNLLVGKEQPLFCTFEGIPSKDGVILTTATGECINVKVNEYLTPGWKREDPAKDTKCFTVVDLEYAKLGNIGENVKALVLYGAEVPFRYFMCPYDVDHITHVTLTMPEMLEDYCKSAKGHYIPRAGELCLAVYEGAWYRGLCLKPSETPTKALIHFIDFGNMEVVDHTNIRLITKDFMSPAALGCICEVKNLGIELVNGQIPENLKARLDTLIPLNDIVDVKIVQIPEHGEYEVELPQVRQKLVEEGLVN